MTNENEKEVTTVIGFTNSLKNDFKQQGIAMLVMFCFLVLLVVNACWNEYTKQVDRIEQNARYARLEDKCNTLELALREHLQKSTQEGIRVIQENNELLKRVSTALDRRTLAANIER